MIVPLCVFLLHFSHAQIGLFRLRELLEAKVVITRLVFFVCYYPCFHRVLHVHRVGAMKPKWGRNPNGQVVGSSLEPQSTINN